MAIARDTIGTRTNSGAVTNPSQTFNNAAGNFLVVGFFYDKNGSITAATYNGVTMTEAVTVTMTGWVYKVSIYYLASPATGSNTVAFTLSTSAQATIIQAISYSGVNTSSPVDSTSSNYLTGVTGAGSQSITLTPTTNNGWFVGFCNSSGTGHSAGANTSVVSGGTVQDSLLDSNGTITTSPITMNVDWTGLNSTEGAGLVGFTFKDATPTTASGFIPRQMLLGVC